jgi:hypothetical protein
MTTRKLPHPATRAEFFAAEAAAWKALSGLWRGLPEAALLEPGASGPEWSIKDVMNHLAAWMEATCEVMPRLLAGQKLPKGEYHIPAFNARHSAADAGRSLPASRRRLNRARRAVLAYSATLPEPVALDTRLHRPGRWIKYATYGHYEEHFEALREFRRKVAGQDAVTR